MRYVYPAIFSKDKELNDVWVIEFPDVAGALTQGHGLYDALEMAEDSLAGMLVCWEDYKAGKSDTPMNNRIVAPTPIKDVKVVLYEYSSEAFVTLIKCDTDEYRKKLAAEKAGD